jgi:hypothetical protein
VCWSDDVPTLALQLRDKTGIWPIEGLMVRAEQGLKMPSSNANVPNLVAARFNNIETGVFDPPAAGQRNIPAREQVTVTLSFRNLRAGEHVIPLQFFAKNSGEDASQRVTVTLQVRDSAVWATLVLILAALLSFVTTKVLTTLRQRALFLERVRTMRTYWLASEPSTPAVIWFRATLRQAEDLSKRYWLTGQSEIDAKLNTADGMLAVLTRVRDVRNRIGAITTPEIRRRALWVLGNIISRIPATSLSEQGVTQFKAELDKLDGWCDPNKMEAEYWANLLSPIRSRVLEVKPDTLTGSAQGVATELHAKLDAAANAASAPSKLSDKIALEEAYQRLTVLWQVRDDTALVNDKLCVLKKESVDKVFAVIDDANWEALTKLSDGKELALEGPAGDVIEAYEPVTFKIRLSGRPALQDSYLVQKKLSYHWTITICDSKSKTKTQTLHVESSQPEVAQFSPAAGRMKATVRIKYNSLDGPQLTQQTPTSVRKSTTFRAWRIVETADYCAFLIALLISVVSGLALYGLGATFGSFKDYLALFTWGASIDQGKNFIQTLAAYKR